MVRQSLLSRRAAASAQRRCLSRNAGRWCLIDTETGQIKTPNGPDMTIFSPDGRHGYLRYTVARIADGHPISRISRCRSITQGTFCSDTVGLGAFSAAKWSYILRAGVVDAPRLSPCAPSRRWATLARSLQRRCSSRAV